MQEEEERVGTATWGCAEEEERVDTANWGSAIDRGEGKHNANSNSSAIE